MFNNIPEELRLLPQWVVWREEIVDGRPTKVPYNPNKPTNKATVSVSNTWGTFQQAVATAEQGFDGIGFVLTDKDPYAAIDIDDKVDSPISDADRQAQLNIYNTFQSYTEKSPSGRGCHIILKGSIPSGVKRGPIEIYSDKRYMTFTGDVLRDLPIIDYSDLLLRLYQEMAPSIQTVELMDFEAVADDEEILRLAMGASNGDKFDALCRGEWQDMGYPSQSEADFALLSILAFYTRDNEQVRRLFRMSALGKRDKATKNDKHLDYALRKIRANEPPMVDLSNLKVSDPVPEKEVTKPADSEIPLPPGLIGDMANYIYSTSVRPVREMAIAAAIGLMSGIAARSYNISGTGLNQYLIMVAKTGSGKEGVATGIDNLVAAVRPAVPMVDHFIGPGAFASGQGLIKYLDDNPCFISVLGEFGLTLQQLCDPRANSPQIMLKKVLLDLYSKSGWNKVLRSTVYSDSDKNTSMLQAPNVTILGETTPETFFNGLDTAHIAEGLIPRFTMIEYTGPRPKRNKNAGCAPSQSLVNKLTELVTVSLTTQNNGVVCQVACDDQAAALLDAFDEYCDNLINNPNSEVDAELWNRGHLKALKLAALVAVGINIHQPVITASVAEWAIDFTRRDISVMATRFRSGEVGKGSHLHEVDIRRAIKAYLDMSLDERFRYDVPAKVIDQPIIPFHYLRRRLRLLTSFKEDPRGVARAINESLADLVSAEILDEIPPQQVREQFGIRSRLFVTGRTW